MKQIIAFLFICLANVMFSQVKADDVVGTYMTDKNVAMVEITKRDGKYYGKLSWAKTPGKLDTNNPDEKQKTDKLVGKEILKDFVFNGKDLWHNGTIYDPKNGKTYSCKITRDEKGNLNVRGYLGVSMLGRTTFWVKVK